MPNRRSLSWGAALRDLRNDRADRPVVREERLRTMAGLRGTPSLALSAWRGRSGARYVVGIHDISSGALDDLTNTVVLAVVRTGAASRILRATADIDSADSPRWIDSVRRGGATEIHVHRLAETAAERRAVVVDLTAASAVASLGKAA